MTRLRSLSGWNIAAIAAGFGLAAVAIGVALGGPGETGALFAARYTARASFFWFLAAWSASSLAQLWPGGWRTTLLARRRAVGIGFAVAHGIHFAALVTATVIFARGAALVQILFGGIGYAFVLAMAVTSNDASVRALGPRHWKLLHATGGWVLFVIFAVSYARSLAAKPFAAVLALTLLFAALALRIVVAARKAAWLRVAAGALGPRMDGTG